MTTFIISISVFSLIGFLSWYIGKKLEKNNLKNNLEYKRFIDRYETLLKDYSNVAYIAEERDIYYRAVYKALEHVKDEKAREEVISILMESKTFKKVYELKQNIYVNDQNIHIDKDVYDGLIANISNKN